MEAERKTAKKCNNTENSCVWISMNPQKDTRHFGNAAQDVLDAL